MSMKMQIVECHWFTCVDVKNRKEIIKTSSIYQECIAVLKTQVPQVRFIPGPVATSAVLTPFLVTFQKMGKIT